MGLLLGFGRGLLGWLLGFGRFEVCFCVVGLGCCIGF